LQHADRIDAGDPFQIHRAAADDILGSAVLTTISAIQNGPLLQTVLTVTVFATSLQLGYVFAALMKYRVIPLPSQTYAIAATENPEISVRLSSLGPKSCAKVLDPSLVPKSRIQIIRLALVTAASRSAPRARRLDLDINPADAECFVRRSSDSFPPN
jgi:hypothetical protein